MSRVTGRFPLFLARKAPFCYEDQSFNGFVRYEICVLSKLVILVVICNNLVAICNTKAVVICNNTSSQFEISKAVVICNNFVVIFIKQRM